MSKLAPFCPFFFSLSSVFFYTVTQSFTKAREILRKRRKKKYREENQINISKITLDITKKIFYYIYSPVRHTFSKAILLSPISDFAAQLYYILLNKLRSFLFAIPLNVCFGSKSISLVTELEEKFNYNFTCNLL